MICTNKKKSKINSSSMTEENYIILYPTTKQTHQSFISDSFPDVLCPNQNQRSTQCHIFHDFIHWNVRIVSLVNI